MNILLVDDDVFIRAYLQYVLSSRGHSVVQCSNGIEALVQSRTHPFDMAVVDVVMQEMDGISLVKRLKREHHELPVLALSDESDGMRQVGISHLELMMRAGADRALEKPFDEKDFISAIEQTSACYIQKARN